MELFNALGINLKIFIAQLINFAILLLVLWKFAYKPMHKFLEDRKAKIEEGVENAYKAGQRLEEIAKKEESIVKNAKKEAAQILAEASKQAEANKKKAIEKVREEVGIVINKEKQSLQIEKANTLKEIKAEMGVLVTAAVEKILGEKMDSQSDQALIKKSIKNIK